MPPLVKNKDPQPRLWVYTLVLVLGWTIVICLSLWWNLDNEKKEALGSLREMTWNHQRTIWGGHLGLWLLGLAGIGLGGTQLSRKMKEQLQVERALRESQERFTHIIDSSLEVIWEIDRERRYTYLSPTVQEVLGYAPAEMLGKPFYDFFHPEEREAFIEKSLSPEKQEKFKNFLNRHIRKDGQIIWLLTSGVPFFGEQGAFRGYRGTNIDVTARKSAEDGLIRQKGLLEAINQIFQKALDCRTEEELAGVCLSRAEELTDSPRGWIGEINPAELLDTMALTDPGWAADRVPEQAASRLNRNMEIRGLWGRVIREERALISNAPGEQADRIGLSADRPPLTSFMGVPLKHQGRLLGLIALENKESGYTGDDQKTIEHLAPVIIETLFRKRAERKLKEKEELWKIIMESVGVGVVLIDQQSLTIVEANPFAAQMIGSSRDQVVGRPCRQFFHAGEDGRCPLKASSRSEKTERVLKTAQGGRIPILKTVVPVVKDGHPYLLESFIDLTEQRQAEEALSQANARLQGIVQEVGQTNRDMKLLRELGELLQLCQSIEEAFPILAEYGSRLFPEEAGGLFLLNNSGNMLEAVSVWGEPDPGKKVFPLNECWALRRGKAHHVTADQGSTSGLVCRHLLGIKSETYLCLPLTAQGETLGLIHLRPKLETCESFDAFLEESSGSFGEARIKFVESVAEHVSLALSNLKLREKLRQQAIRDPLTGLFNKRYLQETLEREVERARRNEQSLGVLMLDLDHFKRFNDTHGHEAGDELLRSFGRLLKKIIRVEDIACRYGGEEFTLILPECPLPSLVTRAEEIRLAVEALQIQRSGAVLGPVTISIGAAVFPDQGGQGEALLQLADAALYQAKKSGRNRVVVAGESAKEPDLDPGRSQAA